MQSDRRAEMKLLPVVTGLALLLIIAILVRVNLYSINPLEATASEKVFSAGRAFDYLQQIMPNQQPHPVDSDANDRVGQSIIEILKSWGYTPQKQETRVCRDSSRGLVRCVRVQNIIVHIPGSQTDNGILLSAHYDSVPAAPGGSDAGAAIGTLLEVARLLKQSLQPKNSIVILFNEGEEFGLFGARAFMEGHPLAKTLKLAINVEARGSQGQSVMFETGENSGWLVDAYAKSSPAPLTSSLFYEVYKFLPNDTDLTIFKSHGLQGLNFAHAEQLPHYHTPMDNLQNLDRGSLQHHGDNVWGVLQQIKDRDLTQTVSGNRVYTDILGKYVISWPESWSLWFVLLLWGGFLLIGLSLHRRRYWRGSDLFKGILAQPLLIFVCGVFVWLVQEGAQLFSSHHQPWFANGLSMRYAVWFMAVGGSLWSLRLLVGRAQALGLILGYTLVWLIFATALSVTYPGLSFLFILPVVLSLMVLGLHSALFKHSKEVSHAVSALVICAGSAIIFLPVVYVLEIMVGFSLSVSLGIVLAFCLVTLSPLLVGSTPNRSRIFSKTRLKFSHIVLAILTVGFGNLLWTSFQNPYSEWSPQPLNIQYLQTAESSKILIGHPGSQIPEALSNALPALKVSKNLPWSGRQYFSAPIPSEKFQQPRVSWKSFVQNDQQSNETQSIEGVAYSLSIESSVDNLSDIVVYIPVDTNLKHIKSPDGQFKYAGESARYGDYYQYHCRGRDCRNLALNLWFERTISSNKSIWVAEYRQGLPNSLKETAKLRGALATQIQSGDQSIVLTEISLNGN